MSVSKASKEKGVRCVTLPSLSSPLLFEKLFQIIFPLIGLDIQNVECEYSHHDKMSLFLRNLLTFAFMDSHKGHQETSKYLDIG